jgi:P27 family predicted phage terminase small subunit
MPMPAGLRILTGSHLERLNDAEPIPFDNEPDAPAEAAPEVLEVWHSTVRELRHMRTLARCDADALRAYCEAVVQHRRASRTLAQSELLLKGLHGGPVRNPAIAIQRDAANLVRQFAQEFGLTPASRTRIRADEAVRGATDDDSPFAGTG